MGKVYVTKYSMHRNAIITIARYSGITLTAINKALFKDNAHSVFTINRPTIIR